MGKQAKPKQVRGSNPDRPNGKAWKSSWGSNPPLEQSKRDSSNSHSKKKVK